MSKILKSTNKVMIIGTGNVGSSIGFSLVTQRTSVRELVLTDINTEDAEGEAMDLRDTLAVSPKYLNIHTGTYESDAKDCDIIVITAGIPQRPGESRTDLLQQNAKIFKDMIARIMKSGFKGIFIVVSNPMDVLTYLVYRYSGLPANQVIGSGTILDTARLRYRISEKLEVSPQSIHAYQIGEHGDSEFTLWSSANFGGQPLKRFLTPAEMQEIEKYVRNEAYDIIKKKGATYYGIGACVASLINCIIDDERRVLPVSVHDHYSDTYYGFPAVIGHSGVIGILGPRLTEAEGVKLQTSINTIRANIDAINL